MARAGRARRSRPRASCSATAARSCSARPQRGRLPGRQPQPPLPGDRQGARPSSASTRRCTVEEGLRRSLVWYHHNRSGGSGLMTDLRSSAPATSASSPARASRSSGHDVVCVDVDRSQGRRDQRAAARRSTRTACRSCCARHVGTRLRATTRPGGGGRGSDVTFIAVGTPVGDGAHRPALRRAGRRARSAPRCASKPGYHTVVVKSTVCRARPTASCAAPLEARLRQARRRGLRPRHEPGVPDRGPGRRATSCTRTGIVLGGIDARTHAAARRELYAGFARRAAHPHQHRDRRDDQVRLERAAGDGDLVLQRDRAPVRGGRRHRRRRGDARRARVARISPRGTRRQRRHGRDRELPRGRLRLRRQLPAEGRDGARRAGRGRSGVAMPLLDSVLEVNAAQPDEMVRPA